MVINKEFTNLEIFNIASALIDAFENADKLALPVKITFYLQKNINKLVELAKDIEANRVKIIQKYGTPTEEDPTQYKVAEEDIGLANDELNDLFALVEEVPIYMLQLDWFDKIDLTPGQVQAISFMITEE